jgi:O-antigen ligase/tetratricopeptide (TPR) repeat protein
VIRLLAVLLLFAAVRNNTASAPSLRRLSWAVFINGVFLSIYGVMQYLPGHNVHTIFGTVRVQGQAFGPFPYRNYYACYANLCIGFGAGLLLGGMATPGSAPDRRTPGVDAPRGGVPGHAGGSGAPLLQRLFVAFGLALLVGVQFVCQSRGGVIALFIAGIVLAPLWERRVRKRHLAWVGGAALVVLAAVTLLGYDWTESRLLGEDVLEDGRLEIWARVLPRTLDFPVWGTGYGTFPFVEQPLQGREYYHVIDYAHNEYLEGLLEGGVLRLAISLAAIFFVFRCGLRAVRRSPGDGRGGLAVGALLAVTTLVVHSVGEFVLHLPSIVVLGTVTCATLCRLGRPRDRRGRQGPGEAGRDEDGDAYSVRAGGLAPLGGMVVVVSLGLVLSWEGWKAYRAQRLLLAAMGVGELGRDTTPETRIARLQAATEAVPSSARLHVLLGEAQLEYYKARVTDCTREGQIATTVRVLLSPPGSAAAGPGAAPFLSDGAGAAALSEIWKGREKRLAERLAPVYLPPALRHYLQARNLCPLMAKPHVRIAANREWFKRADPPEVYLDRARSLVPCDAELWYCCGAEELKNGRKEAACKSWWHCLELSVRTKGRPSPELSDRYVKDILTASRGVLGPREIADGVMLDEPQPLITAIDFIRNTQGTDDTAELVPYSEKALAAYASQSMPMQAEDYYQRARIYASLGRLPEALADYRVALDRMPLEVSWRYELAELLDRLGQLDDAERELRRLLLREPAHEQARRLLGTVLVEMGVEKR